MGPQLNGLRICDDVNVVAPWPPKSSHACDDSMSVFMGFKDGLKFAWDEVRRQFGERGNCALANNTKIRTEAEVFALFPPEGEAQ